MKSVSSIGLMAAVIISAQPVAAQSSLETDRAAGVCASYFTLLQRSNAAARALSMADNQDRALQFAMNEFERIKSLKDRGIWDKNAEMSYAVRADGECRKVGMRPADYSN
jgi:hypothetical protein